MSQPIRVFVADDIDQVRSALKDTLAKTQDIEVVGEASDGHALVAQIKNAKVDVLLLDLKMPDFDCLRFLAQLYKLSPMPHVIIISSMLDYEILSKVTHFGLTGYLYKEDALGKELPQYVRMAMNGDKVFSLKIQEELQ